MDAHRTLLHRGVLPDVAEDLLVAEELTLALHERDEDVDRTPAESNLVPVFEQYTPLREELKPAKSDRFVHRGGAAPERAEKRATATAVEAMSKARLAGSP